VQKTQNDKWLVQAYSPDSLVWERAVADSKEAALLQLAGKLLERLVRVHDGLDTTRGSFPMTDLEDVYIIKDEGE